ncbi:hypothetical protein J6590_091420 [Homalodisca vitripennis]|nr:hypothetical protein J6590_091420 [Homalodisca vitripennis]
MDFFVWGFFKQEVYSTPVNSEEELRGRIGLAAQRLRGKLSFKMTVEAMRKRARACKAIIILWNSIGCGKDASPGSNDLRDLQWKRRRTYDVHAPIDR